MIDITYNHNSDITKIFYSIPLKERWGYSTVVILFIIDKKVVVIVKF